MFNITQVKPYWDGNRRSIRDKGVVFVDVKSNDLDMYFRDNITSLNVKSKAWSKLMKHYHNLVIGHISTTLFDQYGTQPQNIKFSRKAGCACGCSPGYLIESVNGMPSVYLKGIWMTGNFSAEEHNEIAELIKAVEPLLQKDIKADYESRLSADELREA